MRDQLSADFTAAMVTAQLVEIDPTTGERLDYLQVAKLLESEIRDVYRRDGIDIHIIGFARIDRGQFMLVGVLLFIGDVGPLHRLAAAH